MSKLRVGVIGCGKIAQVRHIPEYLACPDAEVIAVCDANPARAAAVASTFGIARAASDYQEIISAEDIDAVSVCTPNNLHAPLSLAALSAGKHVLVEKPMALTWSECLKMTEAARKHQKILMVGMNQRFLPLYRRVKEIVASGQLGAIRQFSSNFHHGGPEGWSVEGANSWFTRRRDAGFGVIGDLGVHKIDLIQWLLHDEVGEVSSYSATFAPHRDVEDAAVMALRMKKGAVGTIHLSWNNPLQDHRTVLYGERGVLMVGETICGITVNTFDGKQWEEEVPPVLRTDGLVNSGVINHFVESVRGGQQPESSGEAVLHAMRVFFAAANGGAFLQGEEPERSV
ncbi:MAG: Gfo/Idh/MocA family oxidoreductase [Brevibacillus sp.]|nr:Gfo/Idh/MocA family oxidoreductase [Brevibacillus sp.]